MGRFLDGLSTVFIAVSVFWLVRKFKKESQA